MIIKYINYNVEYISTKEVPERSGCGSDPILLRELIRELGEALGVEPEIIQVPMPRKGMTCGLSRVTWSVPSTDISRSRAALGYQPRTPIREGPQLFADWTQA